MKLKAALKSHIHNFLPRSHYIGSKNHGGGKSLRSFFNLLSTNLLQDPATTRSKVATCPLHIEKVSKVATYVLHIVKVETSRAISKLFSPVCSNFQSRAQSQNL